MGDMLTNPMYRENLSWTATFGVLDSICSDLDVEWLYDSRRHLVIFRESKPKHRTAHDLEVCFGDPDYLEFKVWKSVVMRMPEVDIQRMLELWLKVRSR